MKPRRAWYEPTLAAGVKAFFKKVDWSKVDPNVERLPYLAQQPKKNTPCIKAIPAKDEELYPSLKQPDWKERLNSDNLAAVDALLRDYDACLSRIWACRIPAKEEERCACFLREWFPKPGLEDVYALLTDFHFSGYYILGSIGCDLKEENPSREKSSCFAKATRKPSLP